MKSVTLASAPDVDVRLVGEVMEFWKDGQPVFRMTIAMWRELSTFAQWSV